MKTKDNKQNMQYPTYEQLMAHYDFSMGLWCIDQDPKDVDIEWIREHAFQLTSIDNNP